MKVEFIYPNYYDLVFHVLAYFKVNNASNLYDENYIKKMEDEKNISNDIFTAVKYSLQETTQGNGQTGADMPVRFSM